MHACLYGVKFITALDKTDIEPYQNFCQIFRRLALLLLATRKVNIQQPTEIKCK